MCSFSSVNNFRATVSGGWRHFDYYFNSSNISPTQFDFYNNTAIARRCCEGRVFRKLGLYFSHFLFSGQLGCSNLFYFDSFFNNSTFNRATDRIFSFLESRIYVLTRSLINPDYNKLRFHITNDRWESFGGETKVSLGRRKWKFYSRAARRVLSRSKNVRTVLNMNRFFSISVRFLVQYSISFRVCKYFGVREFSKLKYGFFRLRSIYFFHFREFGSPLNFKKHGSILSSFFTDEETEDGGVIAGELFGNYISSAINFSRLFLVDEKESLFFTDAKFSKNIQLDGNMLVSPGVYLEESINRDIKVRRLKYLVFKIFRFFLSYMFKSGPNQVFVFLDSHIVSDVFERFESESGLLCTVRDWSQDISNSVLNWFIRNTVMGWFRFPVISRWSNYFEVGALSISSKFFGFRGQLNLPSVVMSDMFGYCAISSELATSMFKYRLESRERVNPVFYSVLRLLLFHRSNILGLTISRSGRFTKRQRAAFDVYRVGRTPFNSYVVPFDFSFKSAILKYSMVSLKIWIAFIPQVVEYWVLADMASNFVYPSNLFTGSFGSSPFCSVYVGSRVLRDFNYYKLAAVAPSQLSSTSKYVSKRKRKMGRKFPGLLFQSGYRFIPSFNFKFIRAYRRFAKFFVYSRGLSRAKKKEVW